MDPLTRTATISALSLCIVFFFGALGHQLTEEQQELVNMLHSSCVEETGVVEEVVQRAQKGDFDDDETLKCYMKCVLEQMGCIDEEGIIDPEAVLAVLPEEYHEQAAPVIHKCETQIGANPCDNAFLTNKCWYKEEPDDYFLV